MQETFIVVEDAARSATRQFSEQGDTIRSHRRVNKFNHAVLYGEEHDHYLVYKRAPFLSFGLELDGKNRPGETINVSVFKAIQSNPRIQLMLFAYPQGTIYYTTPHEFNNHSHSRRSKATGEYELAIDLKHLKPLKERFKCVSKSAQNTL